MPFLPQVLELAAQGFITGASGRNWAGYQQDIQLAPAITAVQQALLCDPQTSGGLLVACDAASVEQVLACFRTQGFEQATVIGELQEGIASVEVI